MEVAELNKMVEHLELCDLESEEFKKLPLIDRVVRNLGIIIFWFYNYDTHSIYKGDYKRRYRAKYKIYLRPELRIAGNNLDGWRLRVRLLFVISFWFVFVRYTIVVLVQFAKYQATTYSEDNLQITSETWLIRVLKRLYLFDLFDNILSDFSGTSISWYVVILITVAHMVYIMPHKFSIEPLDCLNYRITLDPERERRRVNIITREKIESLILSMNSYKLSQSFTFPSSIEHQKRKQVDLNEESATNSSYELRGHVARLTLDSSLRSVRYTVKYYQTSARIHTMVTLVAVPLLIGFFTVIITYTIRSTADFKCRDFRDIQQRCTIATFSTLFELYTLVELVCPTLWFGIIFGTFSVVFVVQLKAQLVSISEMKFDFESLLSALSLMNRSRPQQLRRRKRQLMRTLEERIHPTEEVNLSVVMFKMLVKTTVSLAEFRNQADNLSRQVEPGIIFFSLTLMLTLMAGRMEGPDIFTLRAYLFIFPWVCSNMMLIACAHQHARITKLNSIGWSILARLNERLVRRPRKVPAGDAYADPLMIGWRRLIQSGSLVDARNSIRPFGISLTFKQILQMNFYLASLAVLVAR